MAVALLEEFGLPLGLLPLADVIEVGFVRATGYMWIAQRKKVEHQFKKISKQVSYDVEITGYVKTKCIKKLKGVKAKELMLWPPVNEIYVDDPPTGKIHSRALPASPRPSQLRPSPPASRHIIYIILYCLRCATVLVGLVGSWTTYISLLEGLRAAQARACGLLNLVVSRNHFP
ncbi:hypothetical protein PR202_ga06029 [Eleusine coracana subsp. coracana]|uniref:Uncharacterized protein n=1 Tax=Eleusine coracana subsp. coracana TaxID=191504 RepID=A0AAV5BW55_ELECO|nr:hypothetical protein PR202_ga06029 [Eleusine coracana subsp. coracana]